ncbi:hypothetical protein FE63_15585, partial [Staphylococcus aureus]
IGAPLNPKSLMQRSNSGAAASGSMINKAAEPTMRLGYCAIYFAKGSFDFYHNSMSFCPTKFVGKQFT